MATYKVEVWKTAKLEPRFIPMRRMFWFWWKRFVKKGYRDFHANCLTMEEAENYIKTHDTESEYIAIYLPDDNYTTPAIRTRIQLSKYRLKRWSKD